MSAGQEDSTSAPRTNGLVIQNLIERSARRIIDEANLSRGTQLILKVQPAEDRWIVEQAVSSALLAAGCVVRTDTAQAAEIPFAVGVKPAGISIMYGEAFRSGLFTARRSERTVSCVLAFEVTEPITGNIRLSKTVTETMHDTVETGQIPRLEDPASRSTQGVMPDEPLLDRIAEPLVIIGASGVIIYLFFHIRS